MLRTALAAYARGEHARFFLLALPAFEAGLRAAFVVANPTEAALGEAHLGARVGRREQHVGELDVAVHLLVESGQGSS